MTDYVYVLRCVHADMSSSYGFTWPESGPVECSDWDPKPECGHGLHGWLWGEGDLSASGALWASDGARWLVVRVAAAEIVQIGGKVKFPRGEVVFCGPRTEAANRICELGAVGAVHFATRTAGDRGTATAGYYGTATAGYRGTATAGDYGTATAGDSGTATAGVLGTATAGDDGIIAIAWWDSAQSRHRLARGLVGENGIEPNVPYVVRYGKLVRKDGVA